MRILEKVLGDLTVCFIQARCSIDLVESSGVDMETSRGLLLVHQRPEVIIIPVLWLIKQALLSEFDPTHISRVSCHLNTLAAFFV